jgi:hypothetical protein
MLHVIRISKQGWHCPPGQHRVNAHQQSLSACGILQGTNVGAQLRKLYEPAKFSGAKVLGLFDATYGKNRSRVCAIGVEANPVHTPYLQKLNAYFKRRGYQAVVLTDTAASIHSGKVRVLQLAGGPPQAGCLQ